MLKCFDTEMRLLMGHFYQSAARSHGDVTPTCSCACAATSASTTISPAARGKFTARAQAQSQHEVARAFAATTHLHRNLGLVTWSIVAAASDPTLLAMYTICCQADALVDTLTW
jgi:hypothetical protein